MLTDQQREYLVEVLAAWRMKSQVAFFPMPDGTMFWASVGAANAH